MSSRGLWPAMREMGVQMVAYGTWGFAGTGDVVVTHTVYEDFDHWYATRRTAPGHRDGEKVGAFYDDPQIVEAISHLMPIYAERDVLIEYSEAYPFLLDEELSRPKVHYRTSHTGPSPLPPTFGRGSIVEEVSFEFDSDDTVIDPSEYTFTVTLDDGNAHRAALANMAPNCSRLQKILFGAMEIAPKRHQLLYSLPRTFVRRHG